MKHIKMLIIQPILLRKIHFMGRLFIGGFLTRHICQLNHIGGEGRELAPHSIGTINALTKKSYVNIPSPSNLDHILFLHKP